MPGSFFSGLSSLCFISYQYFLSFWWWFANMLLNYCIIYCLYVLSFIEFSVFSFLSLCVCLYNGLLACYPTTPLATTTTVTSPLCLPACCIITHAHTHTLTRALAIHTRRAHTRMLRTDVVFSGSRGLFAGHTGGICSHLRNCLQYTKGKKKVSLIAHGLLKSTK